MRPDEYGFPRKRLSGNPVNKEEGWVLIEAPAFAFILTPVPFLGLFLLRVLRRYTPSGDLLLFSFFVRIFLHRHTSSGNLLLSYPLF